MRRGVNPAPNFAAPPSLPFLPGGAPLCPSPLPRRSLPAWLRRRCPLSAVLNGRAGSCPGAGAEGGPATAAALVPPGSAGRKDGKESPEGPRPPLGTSAGPPPAILGRGHLPDAWRCLLLLTLRQRMGGGMGLVAPGGGEGGAKGPASPFCQGFPAIRRRHLLCLG